MIFDSAKEKFIFYKIPTILFSLIPLFLITGPFLSDLSISLISLLFLFYCLKKKNFTYFNHKYFYFFLIFWIYLIINSLINNFNIDSLKISVFYFRYGVFVLAISTYLNIDDKFIKYFFYCIFFCFIALILDGFYQYFNGENILGWKNTHRTSSFFGEEKILGSYLSRLWPIFFGLSIFIFKRKDKQFFMFILIFILSEALIFLSGDRTAFFYINLSAIFVILFSKKLLKLRLLTLTSSILLLIIISFINPTAKERVVDQTLNQMNLSSEKNLQQKQEGIYIFTREHTHHYLSAYRMFIDNIVLGVGVKNFRVFCKDEQYKISDVSCSSHPHNTYIQILSETGILGFIFLFTVFIYYCFYVIKHMIFRFKGKFYFTDFEICILSGIAIYLWPIAPTGNVFNNWLNIIMILNLPFLIWSRRKIIDNK
ncbi:O-antigen ligase family protein [Candidatus Pelagibacter sp.]|nr:O-antigen ligase family protein [Candidatus Pelagibacter sp.]